MRQRGWIFVLCVAALAGLGARGAEPWTLERALEQALAQSKLVVHEAIAYDVGVIIGSGVGGIWTYTHELNVLNEKGPHRVNPFLIPSITVDVPAVYTALRTGAQGINHGVASACATGGDAIGEAFEVIRRG